MLFAVLLFGFELIGWKAALLLLCGAASALLLARAIERGALWAVMLMSAAVVAITVLAHREWTSCKRSGPIRHSEAVDCANLTGLTI